MSEFQYNGIKSDIHIPKILVIEFKLENLHLWCVKQINISAFYLVLENECFLFLQV